MKCGIKKYILIEKVRFAFAIKIDYLFVRGQINDGLL